MTYINDSIQPKSLKKTSWVARRVGHAAWIAHSLVYYISQWQPQDGCQEGSQRVDGVSHQYSIPFFFEYRGLCSMGVAFASVDRHSIVADILLSCSGEWLFLRRKAKLRLNVGVCDCNQDRERWVSSKAVHLGSWNILRWLEIPRLLAVSIHTYACQSAGSDTPYQYFRRFYGILADTWPCRFLLPLAKLRW